jgi:hypothetical protein
MRIGVERNCVDVMWWVGLFVSPREVGGWNGAAGEVGG